MSLSAHRRIYLTAVALFVAARLTAQFHGPPPATGMHPIDIFKAMHLPPFQDGGSGPLASAISALQVVSRAKTLGISGSSATNAWRDADEMLAAESPPVARPGSAVVFAGATASALNRLISNAGVNRIRLTSATLTIDQPVEITRQNLTIDLSKAEIVSASPQAYMIRIENASGVNLTGGDFTSGDCAVLISNSTGVAVTDAHMSGLTGTGVVVTGSSSVKITSNRFDRLAMASIVIHRGTTKSLIERNQIASGAGFSNMMAGIVVSDREVDLSGNPRSIFGPDGYWVIEQPITQRLNPPHDNLIAWNLISRDLSSGIYSDGGVRNVFFANYLEGNSKEGLCLDNGSTANVVLSNIFYGNGNRWGDPDSILAYDLILPGGRLPNGTAAEKVPGISLDNAIYNVVFDNDVTHNFGGGIKIVRTGYFNAIGQNTILDDNDGAGNAFHFFGIELGAASGSSPDLDFTPSRGNIVFSNAIRGSHYSGIFLDPGSDFNSIRFNVVLDATAWALESAQQMNNSSVNNLTNLPSRNISSGLDAGLVASGAPVNDPPN